MTEEQNEFWIAERQVLLNGVPYWHRTGGLYVSAEAAVVATQRHMDETCRVRRFVDAAELAAKDARIAELEAAVAKAKDALEPHYTFVNNNTGIMVAYNVLAQAARAALGE